MLAVGTLLQNRYRVARQLGKGGMGAVYRGWDARLNIPVAIKEMLPQPGLDPYLLSQLQAQFEQEAGTLARLNHPNLVRVTDFFEENENAYLIMDFVEGDSLADRIAEVGQLPEEQVLIWARQLLDALAYLHNQKFIHRDVKPQNVVIRANGQAVLVDFGLVKLWDPNDPHTKTAMRGLGTPEYAPPEQYGDPSAGHTDPRSDLYSLAATLYHALTGKIPPTATQRIVNPAAMQPIRKIIPNIQESTQEAISKALELQPTARYQNAQEMMEILCADIPFITTGSLKTLPQKTKSQPVEPVNGETPPITSSGKPGSRTITTPGIRQTPATTPPQSITLPPIPQDSSVIESQPPVTP
ncbi:MAG: serine/threonine protein kinase, partial [Anaerolineae bacterium]|nr:serine/threonine protein kinase [Anaerolineae bacterium]